MNRRPSLIVTMEILETLYRFGKMNISQLCTYTRLSYSKLKVKIDSLERAGLVEEIINGGREYTLTPEGRKVLFKLKKYIEALAQLGILNSREEEGTFSGMF